MARMSGLYKIDIALCHDCPDVFANIERLSPGSSMSIGCEIGFGSVVTTVGAGTKA